MRNYLKTKSDVVVVIVSPIVVDVGQTTVVQITTDQPVIALESMLASFKTSLWFEIFSPLHFIRPPKRKCWRKLKSST